MAETVFKTVRDGGAGKLVEVELPAYQSHKTVRAAKILAITYAAERGAYRFALDGGAHVDVTRDWVNSRSPHVSGYFMQYADGYSSFSPARAFEQGYTALPPTAETAPAATAQPLAAPPTVQAQKPAQAPSPAPPKQSAQETKPAESGEDGKAKAK